MVFILLFFFGLLLLLSLSLKEYRDSTFERMHLAVHVLNGQISSAQNAIEDLLQVATDDCNETQSKILALMVKNPSVQSINLSKNDRVICSSYPKLIGEPTKQYKIEPVSLITSNLVAPGKTVILVQATNQDYLVIATLYGYNFSGIIRLLGEHTVFHISSKQGWINKDGDLIQQPNQDRLIVSSSMYPIAISSDINYVSAVITSIKTNPLTVALLTLVALFTSLYYFKYQEPRILKRAIRNGLKNKEFLPYAQALVDQNNDIVGCEVLTRWHYRQSLVSPNLFIPVAETSGLVVPMTLNLLEQVYLTCLKNKHAFTKPFHLGINLSPTQLAKVSSQALLESCQKFTQHPDLKNIVLVLEITERQIINHDEETLDTIKKLHQMGIKVSIDDFGTGYSSLENLREYKIDGLKIDKSFVDGFPDHALSTALIDNILDLATRLDANVTAEGVETQAQANYLIEKGVNSLQGYYFHKPEPFEAFLKHKA